MGKQKINMGTLYQTNCDIYKQLPQMTKEAFETQTLNVAAWFSSRTERKYFMFLCRELNDYTIFEFIDPNYDKAKEELRDLITSRGLPILIDYNHQQDSYEIWIKRNNEVHMYMLFPCDDFIIPISNSEEK